MRSDVQLVPGPPLAATAAEIRIQKSDSEKLLVSDFCFLISARLARLGAVAQLGERELCKLEVVGSIPIGSTRRLPAQKSEASNRESKRQAAEQQCKELGQNTGIVSDPCVRFSVL